MDHAEPRYLESKRSVDRRSLSRRVRDTLLAELPPAPRVLEAGCGTGATVPRLVSWGVPGFRYLGVDREPRAIAFARDVRPKELRRRGHEVVETPRGGRIGAGRSGAGRGDAVRTSAGRSGADRTSSTRTDDGRAGDATFAFETGDALERLRGEEADLVVAQAFLDVVPLEPAIATIEAALAPGGLAYFPITFDGGTLFQPDHPADAAVERAYHAAIDEIEGRDSRAGRHALALLGGREGTLLTAGASDWIVRPLGGRNGQAGGVRGDDTGRYPADERRFLERILEFVEGAIVPGRAAIDRATLADWLATRRRQLAAGELVYVAHQYDLLYRVPE